MQMAINMSTVRAVGGATTTDAPTRRRNDFRREPGAMRSARGPPRLNAKFTNPRESPDEMTNVRTVDDELARQTTPISAVDIGQAGSLPVRPSFRHLPGALGSGGPTRVVRKRRSV